MSKQSESKAVTDAEEVPECADCGKPLPLCICDSITPIKNKISLVILQHPQEQDRALGTARLTALHFGDAVLKIGLSWPSLSKALGRTVDDPSRWAVLYLGSAKVSELETENEIVAINRKGEIEPHQRAILSDIEGIVLLDGTWSQAKALWWRNAWLSRLRRFVIVPDGPSLYGSLRKEARPDAVSTLEAAALALSALEADPTLRERLLAPFRDMLAKARAAGVQPVKRDRRTRR